MARTALTRQTPDADGMTVVYGAVTTAAAPDGHYFDTDGNDLVLLKNTGASTHNMTVKVPVTVDSTPVADRTVPVPAGATVAWKPNNAHRQPSGQVHVNFDHATELTAAVLNV